jgi:general L-amino acid transport system substrate-binding protein
MMKTLAVVATSLFLCVASATVTAQTANRSSPQVEKIKARGALLCPGHNGSNLGFAEVDDKGNWKGFDVDICRAVAAAILGSPDKAKFLPLSWAQRWPSLNSGEIDLVVKTTDATMSRDTELGYQFSIPYLYGAFQFMVPVKMNAKTAKDLNGGTICTSAGTNNARYVADFLKVNNIKAEVLTFEKREEQRAAYTQKRCDADMNWGPTLAVTRASQPDAKEHVILPDVVAVAPQVIIVKEGDDHFLDVINWVLEALLIAEENGITRANVDQIKAKPPNPSIEKLLGVTPGVGARLGLSDQWAYNTIKSMGNFGEIYDRNLGSQSPYKLDRGMNALWRDKGVFVPMLID